MFLIVAIRSRCLIELLPADVTAYSALMKVFSLFKDTLGQERTTRGHAEEEALVWPHYLSSRSQMKV